ncbi:hypothetical protein ID866_7081 [Astraeus odoratus]|nr:hypothetical protein ID866_7081 [Astraeus odoratus]
MSVQVPPMALTSHLVSLSTPVPYEAAISHKFLVDAANLNLPHDRLAFWLSQDRIYAGQAYPRFIAQLITKIPLDSTDGKIRDRSRRTLQVLVACLDNIVREVNFFEDTAKKYDLDIGGVKEGEGQIWLERKATRDYTAEMARIASLGSLEDGLIFLWAMEKVYLDAWTTVSSALCAKPVSDLDKTGRALRDLSYSWSSANPDFLAFVNNIGVLVDEYLIPAFRDVLQGKGNEHADIIITRAEQIWARVVELEAEFWPAVNEEEVMRIPRLDPVEQ